MSLNVEKTNLIVKQTQAKSDLKPSEYSFNQIFEPFQEQNSIHVIDELIDFVFKGIDSSYFYMN